MLAQLRNLPTAFQRLELHLQLAFAGLAALALFALFLNMLPKPAPDKQLLEDYGSILAEQLAGLTVESIVKQDRIALNVLAERIANTKAVAGVAVFGINGQRLAGYGNFADAGDFTFTEPVRIEDANAGYARVVLQPNALLSTGDFNQLAPTIAASLVTCIVLGMLIFWLSHIPLPPGALQAAAGQARTGQSSSSGQTSPRLPQLPQAEPDNASDPRIYLLIVNLVNQLDLNTEARDDVVAECEADVRSVADLYDADWQALPGTGFALAVPARPGHDHSFDAACACLVLAQLCGRNAPHPRLAPKFRFSLQAQELTHGQLEPFSNSDDLADAILRSAVADDAAITVCPNFVEDFSRLDLLNLTREANPALAALRASDATDYYLLNSATGTLAEHIDHQVHSLAEREIA